MQQLNQELEKRAHESIVSSPSNYSINQEYFNNNDKKSVPLEYFKTDAYLIKDGYRPRIDYLKVVDILIGGKIWKN